MSIESILKQTRTIAVVGFSSDPAKPAQYVPAYLKNHGYRVIPVNPTLSEGLGEKAYPDLLSIPEPVEVVLIFRRSEAVPPIVQDAIQIKAKAVWMQQGIVNEEAAAQGRAAGLEVVMDRCMMMEHTRISE